MEIRASQKRQNDACTMIYIMRKFHTWFLDGTEKSHALEFPSELVGGVSAPVACGADTAAIERDLSLSLYGCRSCELKRFQCSVCFTTRMQEAAVNAKVSLVAR